MSLIGLGLLVLKLTILLLGVAGVAHLLRRTSAAVRHLVWMAGLTAALLLPALIAVLPSWRVLTKVGPDTGAGLAPAGALHAALAGPSAMGISTGVLLLWGLGALLTLTWVVAGEVMLRARLRESSDQLSNEWREAIAAAQAAGARGPEVRFVECAWLDAPCTWGVRHPLVLLPLCGTTWTLAQRRDALLHELAHVSRGDLAANLVARLACGVHWYHPLVWLAARASRLAREEACDDAVIAHGVPASGYAALLLSLGSPQGPWPAGLAPTLGLAHHSRLGARLRALLDDARDRAPASRRAVGLGGALGAVMVAALAMAAPAQGGVGAQAAPDAHRRLMTSIASRTCADRRQGHGPAVFSVVVRNAERPASRYTLSVNCDAATAATVNPRRGSPPKP